MENLVSVVIVNWNGRSYLDRCLSSVLEQTWPHIEIVLVDNGSTDGSAEHVRARYPRVRVLAIEENVGFAAGSNLGIRAARGEYVATLNTDTEVEAGWLDALIQGMSASPHVGMCASKMLFLQERDRINSTGIAIDRAGIAWDRDGGKLDREAGLCSGEVFGPCAGAALYRRELLESLDGFDEDFFYLYEDVDLAWRARLAGWRAWYCPTARVYHVHAGAGTEGTPLKSYLLGRNRVWTILKNYTNPRWLVRLPAFLLYDLMAVGYSLIWRRDIHALRGRLAGYLALPKMLRKRARIQATRNVSWRQLAALMAPMRSPWAILERFSHLSSRTIRL